MRIEHIAMYVKELEKAKAFFVKYFHAVSNAGYHNQTTGFRSYFLTFDDGVDPNMTPKILDVLAQQHVHATFFLVGCNITDKVKPILQRQITEGHAHGIHSFSHVYSLLYPNRVGNTQHIVSEVTRTQIALKDQLGQNFKTVVWRYPGGHLSWTGLEAAD